MNIYLPFLILLFAALASESSHLSYIYVTTVSAVADAICIGDFFLYVLENGVIDSKFPPSNTKCTQINGSLSFDGYNSSYAKNIPASILSVRTIDGTLDNKQTKDAPLLNNLVEVKSLAISRCTSKTPWSFKSLKTIIYDLNVDRSETLSLLFPNLVNSQQVTFKESSIALFDAPKLEECGSITLTSCRMMSLAGLKNVKKIKGNLTFYYSSLGTLSMDSLAAIEGDLVVIYYQYNKEFNLTFNNGIDIAGNLLVSNYFDDPNTSINFKILKGSTKIQGSVSIQYYGGYIDLSGLNPVSIGRSIVIDSNGGKGKLFDVSNMSKINGNIIIKNNNFYDYPVFKSLSIVGGDVIVPITIKEDDTMIREFPSLKEVNGTLIFQNIESITDMKVTSYISRFRSLHILENEKLSSLEGLESRTRIEELKIRSNYNLKILKGMSNLVQVDGELEISDNDKIYTFDGFNNIQNIGALIIAFNFNLRSFSGLEKVVQVSKRLLINGNIRIKSLEGFANIQKVESLEISDNKNLLSLRGMNALNELKILNIDFALQTKVKDFKIGKRGTNLGYPLVTLSNYKKNKNLSMPVLKKFLSPICKKIILALSDIRCE